MKKLIKGKMVFVLLIINISFGFENECYKTLTKCGSITQLRKCLNKPLRNYKKIAKTAEDFYNSSLKEYDFFDTLQVEFHESCIFYANIYTIQLINALLNECVKSDSNFNFKAKLLTAKSYLSWGRRGRETIFYEKFDKEGYSKDQLIAAKINCLENIHIQFKKSLENAEYVFEHANGNDSDLNYQSAVLMYQTYSEYSKTFEYIASLYRSADIPVDLKIEEQTAYKDTLLSRANIEVLKGINLLEKFLTYELRLKRYIPTEIDEIKNQLESFKSLKEEDIK